MYASLILAFLLILGITIFALQNGLPLGVKFLFWRFDTSLVAVVLGSALMGALVSTVVFLPGLIRKHLAERRLSRQVCDLEKKLLEPGSKIGPVN